MAGNEGFDRSVIGVVHGEGVGSEVMEAALDGLDAIMHLENLTIDLRFGPELGPRPAFSSELAGFFESVFAAGGPVLCGPAGGRFVYDLRQHFDLNYKLVPLRPFIRCGDIGPLRAERTAGVDVLIVRENVGGLYFGEWGRASVRGMDHAYQTFGYTRAQIERVVREAAARAAKRRKGLCAVVKTDGVPAVSRLWREVLERETRGMGLAMNVLEVDNAAYQLINNPRQFDVIVAPNMFGDVLGDVGALLLGARGMSFSGNFGPGGRAVYQTAHGAAHDIAGRDRSNPIGQILAVAMMLRESLDLPAAAEAVESAVEEVLAGGVRTADIATPGCRIVGTREMGACIAHALRVASVEPVWARA